MRFFNSNKTDSIIVEEEACALDRASLEPALSSIDLDKDAELFWATVDKVMFKKPIELITAVLEANGYVVNLENILACMDFLQFGIHAQHNPPTGEDEPISVKKYNHCLLFTLPNKQRVGDVLSKFYREIESYEARIAELQSERAKLEMESSKDSPEKIQRELQTLREQNQKLRATIAHLNNELSKSQKSHDQVSKALASQNLLPEEVRPARVKDFDFTERLLVLKVGRKTFHYPMHSLTLFPEKDSRCLVSFREGLPLEIMFPDGNGRQMIKRLARVLFVEDGTFKVRDIFRKTWLIEGANPQEKDQIKLLRRHHTVMLYTCDDRIIRFDRCTDVDPRIFAQKVQESIASHQVAQTYIEGISVDEEEDLEDIA